MIPRTSFMASITVILLTLGGCTTFADTATEPVINKKLVLKASQEEVWSALTTHSELEKWWNKGVKLEPFVGGEFYEPWGDGQLATGKVLKLSPLKSIEFTWREKYWMAFENTQCLFIIENLSDKTVLHVEHSGWEVFKDEEKRIKLLKGFEQGWNALLPKLKKYIESNPVSYTHLTLPTIYSV